MGGTCKALSIGQIIAINRRLIDEFGGEFWEADQNLENPGSLSFVLEQIQGSLFGNDPYPTIIEKCAIVCWRINQGHVFHDGCKRTGMAVCWMMLALNGYEIAKDIDTEESIDIALRITTHKITFGEFVDWLKSYLVSV